MVEPLPADAVLLHIGPQKTGTTTLQAALHAKRDELAVHGVHYAGKDRQARVAAAAVLDGRPLPGYGPAMLQRWPRLVQEVQEHAGERVIVSAEMFANADDEAIARVIEDLGPTTQVVITLRPLAKLLPSQWQQYVQSGLITSYADWLTGVLSTPPDPRVSPGFWRRHEHDRLAARWAEVVGPERVTVIVLKEGDFTMNLRVFEQLLGLPDGFLVATDLTNRSFTVPETELLRELNRQYFDAENSRATYEKFVRFGLDTYLKERIPNPDEATIVTPLWALRRADEKAQQIATGLTDAGVRVVGELDWLRVPVPDDGPNETAGTDRVGIETAARAIMGALDVTVVHPKAVGRTPPPSRTTRMVADELRQSLRDDAARATRPVRRLFSR